MATSPRRVCWDACAYCSIRRSTARHARLLIAAWVLLAGAALPRADAAAGEAAARQCWSPGDLKGRAEERRIVQNVARAYAPLPAGDVQSHPLPGALRGVVRRVDLPDGVRKVALTFDLCEVANEVAGYDGAIVDFLRSAEVRATFFAGGKWMVSHAERARQLIADPLFEVGNHTWEHRNLRLLKGQPLMDEIAGAQRAYGNVESELVRSQCVLPEQHAKIVGLSQIPGQPSLLRFPFGACDPQSLRAVEDQGLLAIQWDVSSGDPSRSLTHAQMANAVLRDVRPGSIVLFHANGRGWHTAEALRPIVQTLRAQGYDLVTVSELLNTAGARPVLSQTCYDVRPGDTDHYDGLARRLDRAAEAFKLRYAPAAAAQRAEAAQRAWAAPTRLQPHPPPAVGPQPEDQKTQGSNKARQ